jgi:hypothetical protein
MKHLPSFIAILAIAFLTACAGGSGFEGDQASIFKELRKVQKEERDAKKAQRHP